MIVKHFKYYSNSKKMGLTIEIMVVLRDSAIDWDILDIHNGEYRMGPEEYFKLPTVEQDYIDLECSKLAVGRGYSPEGFAIN